MTRHHKIKKNNQYLLLQALNFFEAKIIQAILYKEKTYKE